MYVHDLLLISIKNLSSRVSRTLFLSIGVLVGTAILLFIIGLIGGVNDVVQVSIDASVEKVQADQRAFLDRQEKAERTYVARQREIQGAYLAQQAEMADRVQRMIEETPVTRLELMPREGGQDEIKESDVEALEKAHGDKIDKIVKIAFLFPMFAEVKFVDFEVEIGGEKIDLAKANRGQRIPVSVYGIDPEEMDGKVLGPDEKPIADPGRFRYEARGRAPVVIPSEWFAFVNNMRNEDMKDRLRQQLTAGIFFMMQDPKNKDRFVQRFGENFLTRGFVEEAVEDAIDQIYEKLKPENVEKHFQVVLYPGLTREDIPIPTQLIGMSRATPFSGLTVPTQYIARWHDEHVKKNTSVVSRLFSGEPEVNYSKLIVYGKSLDATIDLVDALESRYLIGSEIEQARRMREESRRIASEHRAENARITAEYEHETERLQEEYDDLADKERELVAESERIRGVVGAVEDGAWLVGLLIFLLAGVGIVNGLTLSVMEQAKRIGILRAVGARRRDILFIFLAEAFLVGLAGSVLGIVVAEGAMAGADRMLPRMLPADLAVAPETFFIVDGSLRGLVVVVGVLVSLAAGVFPALKGSSIQPVEVLKG